MPKDFHGKPIQIGDVVGVLFRVVAVGPGDKFANVTLETEDPDPSTSQKYRFACNGAQVEIKPMTLAQPVGPRLAE